MQHGVVQSDGFAPYL